MANILNVTSTIFSKINQLKGALTALGVDDPDICNPASIAEQLAKKGKEIYNRIDKVINKTSFKYGGQALGAAAVILAAVFGIAAPTVMQTINHYVILASNAIGAVVSTVVAALTQITNFDKVLQYYQIKNLRNFLQNRKILINLLNVYLDDVMQFISIFLSFDKLSNRNKLSNLKTVINNLAASRNILIREIDMISTNGVQVQAPNPYNIKYAKDILIQTVSLLTQGEYSQTSAALARVETTLNLKTRAPLATSANMYTWNTYVNSLKNELDSSITVFKTESERQRQYYKIISVLSTLLPTLPKTIRLLLLQELLTDATDIIANKFPLALNELSKIGHFDGLSATITQIDYTSTGLNLVSKRPKPNFFTDNNTKGLTIESLTTSIKGVEALILMFPDLLKNLKNFGSYQLKKIIDIKDRIEQERVTIETYIQNNPDLEDYSLLLQKQAWSTNINTLAAQLNQFTNSNAITTYNWDRADKILNELKDFIVEKTFDTTTVSKKTEPIDIAIQTAQTHLTPLLANIAILLSSSAVKKVKAGIQAIKVAFNEQINLDTLELSLCNSYINILENDPAFNSAKAAVEAYLDKQLGTGISEIIAGNLYAGDLQKVLDIVNGVADLMDCVGLSSNESTQAWYIEALNDISEANPLNELGAKTKRWVKDANNAIANCVNTIQDWVAEFQYQANNLILSAQQMIESTKNEITRELLEMPANLIPDEETTAVIQDVKSSLKEANTRLEMVEANTL